MKLPPRLYSLDVTRGLAAFSVIIFHWKFFFYIAPETPASSFQRAEQPFYGLLSPLYHYGRENAVFFFFMLSGFVFFWLYREKIENRSCSAWSFSLARFSRLYPLHIVTLFLVLGLQIVYKHINGLFFVYPFNDVYHFILHLFFASWWGIEKGHSFNSQVWSVSIEIGLYAIFFLLVVIRKSSWPYIGALVAILIAGYELGLTYDRWCGPLETFLIGGLTYYAIRFYLAHRWRNRLTDAAIIALPMIIWVLMAASPYLLATALYSHRILIRLVFPSTIAGLVLLEIVAKVPFSRFKWIGDCTYSSYLLHFPLQLATVLIVSASTSNPYEVFYSRWMLVLFFAILILLSLASYHFWEVPMQKRIRDVGRKWTGVDRIGTGTTTSAP